ncbi:MAG: zinc ABC transporter substrate-binding protein [Ketobacteraceae bacterium]|nr:zinc ABC transporter substrate-binding protein [Ketobacteraceae bacterium]
MLKTRIPGNNHRTLTALARGLAGLLLLLCHGVAPAQDAASAATGNDRQLVVAASIRPLGLIAAELLAPVAPEAVEVIVPATASPHGFSLQPSDMRLVMSAPLLLWLGPEFEPYLEKALEKRPAALADGVVAAVDLSGIRLLPVRQVAQAHTPGHHHHDHHQDEHQEASYHDPHLWWDSHNAILVARALTGQLIRLYPQWQAALTESLARFTEQLAAKRGQLLAATRTGGGFINYHDSLVYLEKELGISSERRVALAPEDKPSVRDMLSLVTWLEDTRVSCVIVEPGVNPRFLEKINGRGALKEVAIDPLGWDASSYSAMWSLAASRLMECARAAP